MVYLLGCDHYLQEYELQDFQEEIRRIEHELKDKFYRIAEELIKGQNIDFVAEECKRGQRTIPRVLAGELGCRYAEIDMSAEERERHGIAMRLRAQGGSREVSVQCCQGRLHGAEDLRGVDDSGAEARCLWSSPSGRIGKKDTPKGERSFKA